MKQSILFVCTGNVCRSPMASALFAASAIKHGDGQRYDASSAGTWAHENDPASASAQVVMERRGLTLKGHRARSVTEDMLQKANLILVMTRHHLDSIGAEFPSVRPKLRMMSELAGQQYDISDPYGAPVDDYEACVVELTRLIEGGYPQIDEWLALVPSQEQVAKEQ